MVYADIGALFVTTFLGVFLGFWLENYRQRRRTTTWVRRYLAHLGHALSAEVATAAVVDEFLEQQIKACDAWLAAGAGEELTETQWELLGTVPAGNAPDFGPVLRAEAVTVVPPELALSLSQTEDGGRRVEQLSREARDRHHDAMQLWQDRTIPLSPSDRRRVSRLRDVVVELSGQVRDVRVPLRGLAVAIRSWLGDSQSTVD